MQDVIQDLDAHYLHKVGSLVYTEEGSQAAADHSTWVAKVVLF